MTAHLYLEAKQSKACHHYFTSESTKTDMNFSLSSFMIFSMMQDVLFVLTMATKPKFGVSAGGMAHTRISL
jgi:hypothetical protein